MSAAPRYAVWLNRVVLAGASVLFTSIAVKYVSDPAGAVAPVRVTLGSPAALTMMRASGGVFLGIALVLGFAASSERRLRAGMGILCAISSVVLAARLYGLAVDGPAPFTLRVLKPEIALVGLSAIGLVLGRRRARREGARAARQPRGAAHESASSPTAGPA